MAGMRYQPQGRALPFARLSGRAIGFLPGVSWSDVFGSPAAVTIGGNPARGLDQHGVARVFDGSSSYATTPLPPFVDLTAPFTVVVAFVPRSLATSRIAHYATANRSFQFTIQGSGSLSFLCASAGSADTARVTSNSDLVVGRAYVAVAAFDGTNYTLHLNGVSQTGTPFAGINNDFTSTAIQLGRRADAASYFAGDIALFAHLQGKFDGASLSANPWQLFAETYEDDEIAATAGVAAALGGSAVATASASGNLSTMVRLAGAAAVVAAAAGALSTALRLTGNAISTASASGSIATGITLAGAAVAQTSVVGTLSTSIPLQGLAAARAVASGDLVGGAAALAGTTAAQAFCAATLSTAITLRGAAATTASAVAVLSTSIRLAGTSSAAAVAIGGLADNGAAAPDGPAIDVSLIPHDRVVVFEGSGSRAVVFEGSGSRVVIFEGSGSRVRFDEMSVNAKEPVKIGEKWTTDRDPDEISYYAADITQELIDRGTTADPSKITTVLSGVALLEGPALQVSTVDGAQRTFVVVKLGGVPDGPLPADWRWVARVGCMNSERFDKTTWFNKVDP